jgi:hypothetical protein
MNKENFLYPKSKFRGEWTPENVVFDDNLQSFSSQINYICNLENAGKIAPIEAYRRIKNLWKNLKRSKKNLIDNNESERSDLNIRFPRRTNHKNEKFSPIY